MGPSGLLYQHNYPDDVAGIVLIEAWAPELFSPVPDIIKQSIPLNQIMGYLSGLGLLRALGKTGILPLEDLLKANLLPPQTRPEYEAAYYRPSFWQAMNAEYIAMEESATDFQSLGSLGDLPLAVIRAAVRPADDYPPDPIWIDTQASLAALSDNSVLIVAEASGHLHSWRSATVVDSARRLGQHSDDPANEGCPRRLTIRWSRPASRGESGLR
jgi:pimeloyl-ACP methyl ester carboxylesterase